MNDPAGRFRRRDQKRESTRDSPQDLRWKPEETSTLWVDAVQLEPGRLATEFRNRAEVEVCMETAETGNLFFEPAAGLQVDLRLFNAADKVRQIAQRVGLGAERSDGRQRLGDEFVRTLP